MFESSSRYSSCEDAVIEVDERNTLTPGLQLPKQSAANKRQIRYKRRRLIPNSEEMALLEQVIVRPGDRLDLISYRVFGDDTQFWRICDANDAMYPPELTVEAGRLLMIPSPW